MPLLYKITISKDVLKQSQYCGTDKMCGPVENNCAIALAVRDLFPLAYVNADHIYPFGFEKENKEQLKIALPEVAKQFIKLFDGFVLTTRLRLLLPEFDFMIEIPDEVVERINIDEIRKLVEKKESSPFKSEITARLIRTI